MSRTKRGSKGAGFEYWSARPGNVGGGAYSPRGGNKINKRRMHKAERRQGAAEAQQKGPAS